METAAATVGGTARATETETGMETRGMETAMAGAMEMATETAMRGTAMETVTVGANPDAAH
jgi:hypothetical protein